MNLTKRSLKKRLLSLGVPLELWEKDGAKGLDDLFAELNKRECTLEGIERTFRTIIIDVLHGNERLVELKQVFNDGRIRKRALPLGTLSEKLAAGERIESGIRRVFEELGIKKLGRDFKLQPLKNKTLVGPSTSYPGLLSINSVIRFRVRLPDRAYKPEGYTEVQRKKKSIFIWRRIRKPVLRKAS